MGLASKIQSAPSSGTTGVQQPGVISNDPLRQQQMSQQGMYPSPGKPQQPYQQPMQQSYPQQQPMPSSTPSYSQQPMQQSYPQQQQMQQSYPQQQSMPSSTPLRVDSYVTPQSAYSSYPMQGTSRTTPTMGSDMNLLSTKLQTIVQQNGLQYFYPQNRLQTVLQRLQTVDFSGIAARWKISKELAYDLAPLALYDIVFYCDDSGSMEFEENGERINDLKLILSKVAEVVASFDDDGMSVRFMNNNVTGDNIRNETDALRLLSQVTFGGITPIGTQLERKIIQPYGNALQKPILCIIITDGEPSGENPDTLLQVIRKTKENLGRTQYGAGAIAFEIAQVGKDQNAQRFLATLDADPVVGHMIDCTSYYEFEALEYQRRGVNLTPELWLLKLCVGSIDRSYDVQDEMH